MPHSIPSSPSPSPSPSPSYPGLAHRCTILFSGSSVVFHIVSITLITALLALSLVSLSLILHLRLLSRRSRHLHNFTSHWSLRLLLVLLASLSHLLIITPPFNNQCHIYIVVLEPGFLTVLLFLVDVSVNNNTRSTPLKSPTTAAAVFTTIAICFSLSVFLYLSVPDDRTRAHVTCTCTLSSVAVFALFAAVYCVLFISACVRVVTVVINKRLRFRMKAMAMTVIVCLVVQVGVMAAAALWGGEEVVVVMLGVVGVGSFVVCAAVAESVLVIRPIWDALAVRGLEGEGQR
ncbi:hypothetical protein Droror1_Dr00013054 [Drosera rotundifolia]